MFTSHQNVKTPNNGPNSLSDACAQQLSEDGLEQPFDFDRCDGLVVNEPDVNEPNDMTAY